MVVWLAAIWFDLQSFTRDVSASSLLSCMLTSDFLPVLEEGKTMAVLQATKSKASLDVTRSDRLFVLEHEHGAGLCQLRRR